jgi:predicted MFS family arabinose efflux permease
MLPLAAYTRGGVIGALYIVSALMAITVTCTELFIPLFLQRNQGHSPLSAGYIAATASAGWTLGALCSASLAPGLARRIARAAPWPCAMSLALLCIAMPQLTASPTIGLTLAIVLSLTVLGFGVGLAWPQLASGVMEAAQDREADLASGAIMTVQLIATTMSAAAGGYLIRLTAEADAGHFAASAAWLFGTLVLAPVAAAVLWPRQNSGAT